MRRFIQCIVGTNQEFENLSRQVTKHFGILLFQKGTLTVKTSQAYFMRSILSISSKRGNFQLAIGYWKNIFAIVFTN